MDQESSTNSQAAHRSWSADNKCDLHVERRWAGTTFLPSFLSLFSSSSFAFFFFVFLIVVMMAVSQPFRGWNEHAGTEAKEKEDRKCVRMSPETMGRKNGGEKERGYRESQRAIRWYAVMTKKLATIPQRFFLAAHFVQPSLEIMEIRALLNRILLKLTGNTKRTLYLLP